MQAKMEVVKGAKTKEIRLRLPSVIGRGGEARVKLPASTVSRHHCEIYEYEGQLVVRDLGSSNGTIVNGHKIKGPTFLTPHDELTIGPVTVRVAPLARIHEVLSGPVTADEVAPSFTELPAESEAPSDAIQADGNAAEEELGGQPDDSVLRYAEPRTPGRSFVTIGPVDEQPEAVDESPVFDGIEKETKPTVSPDESALNNFFNSLDEH